jgi:hypothetical protein
LPDGGEGLARLAGTRLGQQRVVEIFPKLFMLPQVNDGRRLPASFIHHESDSAHKNNLAEKCAEVNFKTILAISLKCLSKQIGNWCEFKQSF